MKPLQAQSTYRIWCHHRIPSVPTHSMGIPSIIIIISANHTYRTRDDIGSVSSGRMSGRVSWLSKLDGGRGDGMESLECLGAFNRLGLRSFHLVLFFPFAFLTGAEGLDVTTTPRYYACCEGPGRHDVMLELAFLCDQRAALRCVGPELGGHTSSF